MSMLYRLFNAQPILLGFLVAEYSHTSYLGTQGCKVQKLTWKTNIQIKAQNHFLCEFLKIWMINDLMCQKCILERHKTSELTV